MPKQINILTDDELYQKISLLASESDTSVAELCRASLRRITMPQSLRGKLISKDVVLSGDWIFNTITQPFKFSFGYFHPDEDMCVSSMKENVEMTLEFEDGRTTHCFLHGISSCCGKSGWKLFCTAITI